MKNRSLQEMLEDAGHKTRSYSGRGMCGKECLAITVDRDKSPMDVAADLIEEASEQELDSHFSSLLRHSRTDSVGFYTVVYWPNVAYGESGDDDDEKTAGGEG